MTLYTELAVDAAELLAEFGGPVTLVATAGDGTTTTRTGSGARLQRVTHAEQSSLVEIGDWYMLVDSSVLPEENALLTFAGETQLVVQVKPIGPSGENVAFEVWTRNN